MLHFKTKGFFKLKKCLEEFSCHFIFKKCLMVYYCYSLNEHGLE